MMNLIDKYLTEKYATVKELEKEIADIKEKMKSDKKLIWKQKLKAAEKQLSLAKKAEGISESINEES